MNARYACAGRLLFIALTTLVALKLSGATSADPRQYGKWNLGETKRLNFSEDTHKAHRNDNTYLNLLGDRFDGLESNTVDINGLGARFTSLKPRDLVGRHNGASRDNRLAVNCRAGESINAAIARGNPSEPIAVTIIGDCAESVYVRRHDVTIRGAGVDASGAPLSSVSGQIEIDASSRVSIFDLSVVNGLGTGISVDNGSSATLFNLRVSGHPDTGIGVSKNSFAQLTKVVVENPPEGINAVFIDDGGDARIRDSVLVSNSGAFDRGAALELSHSANARLEGDNLVKNTGSSSHFNSALAIQVVHSSDLLIHNGANRIVGNVLIASNSNVDVREAKVTGKAGVRSLSRLRLRNTVMRGNAALSRGSMLQSDGASITLGVNCSNSQSIVFNNGLSGSVGSGCTEEFPAPGF